jgi:hypothetical protein
VQGKRFGILAHFLIDVCEPSISTVALRLEGDGPIEVRNGSSNLRARYSTLPRDWTVENGSNCSLLNARSIQEALKGYNMAQKK